MSAIKSGTVTAVGDWLADIRWADWLMSPGFGGTAALLAALIAFRGVRKTVQAQREATRKQQWWDRAKWALDLLLEEDDRKNVIGLEVLAALADSEWAGEHEADVVEAAVRPVWEEFLEESGLEDDAPREPGARIDGAHLQPDDENGD